MILPRVLPALVLLAWATAASAQQDDPAGRWEFFLEQRRSPGVPGWGARLQVARESWTRLGEGVFTGPRGGTTISRIVVDSATAGTLDATTVYAATEGGLFISTDSGVGWRTAASTGAWTGATPGRASTPTSP